MNTKTMLCPFCEQVAFVRDESNPIGFRRESTAGCVAFRDGFIVLTCCRCGAGWKFAPVDEELKTSYEKALAVASEGNRHASK